MLAIVGDHSRHIIKETQCFFVRDVGDGWFIVFARFQSSTLPHTNQNGVMDGLFDLPEISAKSGTIGKQVNPRSPGIFATYKGFFTYRQINWSRLLLINHKRTSAQAPWRQSKAKSNHFGHTIDLSTVFFNFWQGQVRENPSCPPERIPLTLA